MGRNDCKYDDAKANKPFVTRLRILCPESDRQIQTELGNHLGVTRQCVSNWVNGTVKPKEFDTLVKIAQFFNVTVDWLLGMPNASREINADKYQVMKTTGLSETAVNSLLKASYEHRQALETLLCADDFITAMNDMKTAIEYSETWNSFEYYLIPAYLGFVEDNEEEPHSIDEIKKDLLRMKSKYPAIIQINQFVDYLISEAFKTLERQFKDAIQESIYIQLHEAAAKEMEEWKNGNDHGTEE